jgi:membrane-bound lytic murein transglycosylase F
MRANMTASNRRYTRFFIYLIFLHSLLSTACQKKSETTDIKFDLPQIEARGSLVALTNYSATSYFIYKGQPMGYEYELLTRLADHLHLRLEIQIENNLENMFNRLKNGSGDIIARSLTITRPRQEFLQFTEPLFDTRQVLVQRKPDNWRHLMLHQIEEKLIRNPIDLIGKDIYVLQGSAHLARLQHLSDEIGGKINLIQVDGDTTSEQLIQMVADGVINYTVSDDHVALINQAYYQDIDVETPLSLPQRIGWATRKSSPELLQAINTWLEEIKKSAVLQVVYNKYFINRSAYIQRVESDYLSVTGGKISDYDKIIQKHAQEINWDWRLLAALIYKESRFDPKAKSWTGATGLMQLLPAIGREYGARNLDDPRQNIKAGVRYLQWLEDYWVKYINDSDVRLKFILASYNVGIGHVEDARRLAEKYGRDPDRWDNNVAYYLLRLSDEKFFSQDVVEFGYCRGIEPYKYVEGILNIYSQYQKLVTT